MLEAQIANQEQTKTKLIIKSQIDQINKRINTLEAELGEIYDKRNKIVGLTVEKFSEKKSSEQLIRLSLFKTKDCKENLYSEEEYDELDPSELNELLSMYGEFIHSFTSQNIKKIAASTFFMNTLFLCKNDPTRFYGKPIVELTNYQTDLFSLGLSFKSILEKGQSPSADLYNDLDRLVDWYESAAATTKLIDKNKGKDGSTLMGATKQELSSMTEGENVVDLAAEAKKRGGTLSMKDFLEIHDPK